MEIWVLTEIVDSEILTSVHKTFEEAVAEVRREYELCDRMNAYEEQDVEYELENQQYYTDGYFTWQIDSFTLDS